MKQRQDGMVFSSNKLAGPKKQAAQPTWMDLRLRRNVVPFNLDTLSEGESLCLLMPTYPHYRPPHQTTDLHTRARAHTHTLLQPSMRETSKK